MITSLLASARWRHSRPRNPTAARCSRSHCTSCHASNDQRIPTVDELRARTPEAIISALTSGAMQVQGGELSAAEKRAVAEYLAGRIVALATPSDTGKCTAAPPFDASAAAVTWGGWGPEADNTRFQSAERGRPDGRPGAEADAEMGVRISQFRHRAQPAQRRGRPHLRRQRFGTGLRARREDRLHDLGAAGERRRSLAGRHRTAPGRRAGGLLRRRSIECLRRESG